MYFTDHAVSTSSVDVSSHMVQFDTFGKEAYLYMSNHEQPIPRPSPSRVPGTQNNLQSHATCNPPSLLSSCTDPLPAQVFRLFRNLWKNMPEAVTPPDATSFYLQRLNCRQMLEPMLRRSLTRSEQRALLSEAKCSTCFRVRSQLAEGDTLQCCKRCGWGWACTDHAAAYLEGPHKACCGTYALAVESEAALHAFWKETGKLPSNTLQSRRRAYSPLPCGW